jgi:hypothetical protein
VVAVGGWRWGRGGWSRAGGRWSRRRLGFGYGGVAMYGTKTLERGSTVVGSSPSPKHQIKTLACMKI